MNRAAFLDRDGTINRKLPEDRYVTRCEEMHLLPDAPRAIALLNRAGFRVIVVSNQRCVAKGLVPVGAVPRMLVPILFPSITFNVVDAPPHR